MVLRLFLRNLVVFMLAMSVCFRADAQALPAFTGAVNKIIAKTIEKTGLRRGFAANDPRFASTYSGVAGTAAIVAGQVAAGAATAASAPVWLTVAAGLGAAAVVGGLAYGAYKLFFDDSSSQAGFTVVKAGTGQAVPSTGAYNAEPVPSGQQYAPLVDSMGVQAWVVPGTKLDAQNKIIETSRAYHVTSRNYIGGEWFRCTHAESCMEMKKALVEANGGTAEYVCTHSGSSPPAANCTLKTRYPWSSLNEVEYPLYYEANPYYGSGSAQTVKGTISEIFSQLDQSELDKAADPATVAFIANALWQQAAAQPGYEGIPYSASDPVTQADAAAVQQADPASWPRNADLVSPVAQAANEPVPIPNPSTSTDPTSPTDPAPQPGVATNVNVINTPNVHLDGPVDINWGQAPTVHEPTIEGTPTAQQILSPITSMMSGLKAFVVPSHSSACPTSSFTVFDNTFVIDSHCELAETVRPTLFPVMAAVWAVLAALIVLRA